MNPIEKLLGPVLNLVDRKFGYQMGHLRRHHQWPLILSLVSTMIAVGLGMISGGAEQLESWGIPEGLLAEGITMFVLFIGTYFTAKFNPKAGIDEPVMVQ